MRNFLKFSLSTLFVILLPLALLLAIPKLNGFSADSIKENLRQQNVYSQADSVIQSRILTDRTNETGIDPIALIAKELSPDYLRAKTERLIDDTEAWTIGRSQTPPALSLNDIQQKLTAKNPQAKQEIDGLLKELRDNRANVQQLDGPSDDQSHQALQDLLATSDNLEGFANGDWTISLGEILKGLPAAYRVYAIGMPVLILLSLLCLAGVFALGRTMSGRLGSVGWTLVVAAIINTIAALAFWALVASGGVLRMLPHSGPEGDLAVSMVRGVQRALFADYLTIELIAGGILLLVGVVLVVASKFAIPKKAMPPTDATPPSNKNAEVPAAERGASTEKRIQSGTETASATGNTDESSPAGKSAAPEAPASEG